MSNTSPVSMSRERPTRAHGPRRHRCRRATLLTALALSSRTSGGAEVPTDSHDDELIISRTYASQSDSAKSNERSGSRYESIDELGDAYFDVSDWTTSQDGDAKKSQMQSKDDLIQIRRQYGIEAGKWTWPYRLSSSDVELLSADERKYIEEECRMFKEEKRVIFDGVMICQSWGIFTSVCV